MVGLCPGDHLVAVVVPYHVSLVPLSKSTCTTCPAHKVGAQSTQRIADSRHRTFGGERDYRIHNTANGGVDTSVLL